MQGARGILSCASCRQRKLKCDRKDPCSNCVARDAECIYAPLPRGRSAGQTREANSELQGRLRRLEQLVNNVVAQSPSSQQPTSTRGRSVGNVGDDVSQNGSSEPLESIHSSGSEGSQIQPGRVILNNKETIYVSGDHWASVCNEIADLREHIDQSTEPASQNGVDGPQNRLPMLLEGPGGTSELQDVLSDLPPRNIADRLLFRYFSSAEYSIVVLHTPTFEQEYQQFWREPQEFSVTWIGLLFSVMGMGAFMYRRAQEPLPGELGAPDEVMEVFQRRSTECLIMAKYCTTPGPYTMPALLLNIQNEFVRRRDAHLSVWLLAGVAIRLSMRMGYHRDSERYPQFTVWEGEMRRRIWSCMNQLDSLTSYQLGLPSMIQDPQCDTQLPRNLLDEDFGPESTELPPSRPETELTPILYTIAKTRLTTVFRAIYNRVTLARTESYEGILELHKRLVATRQSMSPRLQMTTFHSNVTAPPYVMIRRYNLELLFQKSLCLLHRHHMAKAYHDASYSFSRTTCIEAAMTLLEYQADIRREMRAGDTSHRSRWLETSLQQTDFLMATIICCLELSSISRADTRGVLLEDPSKLRFSQSQLLGTLRTAHDFLDELRHISSDCRKAFDIISVVLEKASNGSCRQPADMYSDPHTHLNIYAPQGNGLASCDNANSLNFATAPTQFFQPDFASTTFDGLDSFFNTSELAEWDLWEAYIRGTNVDGQL